MRLFYAAFSFCLVASTTAAQAPPDRTTEPPPLSHFADPEGWVPASIAASPGFPYADLVERVQLRGEVRYRVRSAAARSVAPEDWSGFGSGLIDKINGYVRDIAVGPDGTVYAGGLFTELEDGTPLQNVAYWDGARWQSLGGGLAGLSNASVQALAFLPDGDLVAVGSFVDAAKGIFNAARWDGAEWLPMGSGLSGSALDIAVEPSGGIYVAGCFTATADFGRSLNYVASWDGSDWAPMGSGFSSGCVGEVAADASGTVYVSGFISQTADGTVTGLSSVAQWDGSVWAQMGSGLNSDAEVLLVDGQGGVYAGGYFSSTGDGATTLRALARWTGDSWSEVGGGVRYGVSDLYLASSGDLFVAGASETADGSVYLRGLGRWDGSTWSQVAEACCVISNTMVIEGDGTGAILFADVNSSEFNGGQMEGVVRWNGATAQVYGLGNGLRRIVAGQVRSVVPDGQGGVYAAGSFDGTADRGRDLRNVAHWDGAQWDSMGGGFGTQTRAGPYASVLVEDDLVVSGFTGQTDGIYLWSDGFWSSVGLGPFSFAPEVMISDGTNGLYAASYSFSDGVGGYVVGHWDGGSWTTVGTKLNGRIQTLLLHFDGSLSVGGDFTGTADGSLSLGRVARWDGSTWLPFGSGLNGTVDALAVFEGDLVAGGRFTQTVDGTVSARGVARWDWTSWSQVGDGLQHAVADLLTDPQGGLLASGSISTLGDGSGCCLQNLVRWDGSSWSTFEGGIAGYVYDLAIDDAGDLLVGHTGWSPNANPTVGPGIARYDLPDVASGISIVIDGERGPRYLGPPAASVTVDDLAAQNLVRGVPGYFPEANANLWTAFDPVAGTWLPSSGTGEVLPLGRAFRWQFLDRDGVGDPEISVSVALPFTLSTDLPANTSDVPVELDTDGTRFNHLANPFGADLDLSSYLSWSGWQHIRGPIYVYDDVAGSWEAAPATIGPWEAFRFRSKGPKGNGGPRILTIPASAALPLAAKPGARTAAPAVEAPAGLTFRLEGLDASGRPLADGMLAFEFSDEATPAFSMEESDVEKFQPPSARYALLGARVGDTFAGHDARPFAPAEIALGLEARGAASAFTLSWDASRLPAGSAVTLVDLETGAEVDVRRASSYEFEAASRPALSEVPTNDLADGSAATDRFILRIGDALEAAEVAVPELGLEAPVPNPAAGSARVAFAVPEAGAVRLAVYDVRGREVAVLVDGRVEAGRHEAGIDARSLAAGVYVVRLEADRQVLTRRATVVR